MPQARRWPDNLAYRDAIQAPQICFKDSRLRGATVRLDKNGIPLAATGKSAIVFHASVASKNVALRCFTRGVANHRSRYQELHAFLAQSLPSYFVEFSYRDQEILVGAERYPVVQMEWAAGVPLHEWVEHHLKRGSDLTALANTWLAMVDDMRARNLAHGDLSNDNCLVNGSRIKLIDYDGCFIPALAKLQSDEAGNPHFQHPERIGYYASDIDAFPALVIYLSLIALGNEKGLWKFHIKDNLIFTRDDYLKPSKTPIWRALAKIPNPQVIRLTNALADMCSAPIDQLPPLSHAVAKASGPASQNSPWWQAKPSPAGAQKTGPVAQLQQSWWQEAQPLGGRTGTVPAQSAAGGRTWLEDQLNTAPPPQGPRIPAASGRSSAGQPAARRTRPTAGKAQPAARKARSAAVRPAPARLPRYGAITPASRQSHNPASTGKAKPIWPSRHIREAVAIAVVIAVIIVIILIVLAARRVSCRRTVSVRSG